MSVIQRLNDQGLTIVLVTHEPDIARYARRIIVVRDGTIRSDEQVTDRLRAEEVLKTLPSLED
jgi:putative ABC transport system ATP-binding protein